MKNAATSIIIAALILLCLWQFFDKKSTDRRHAKELKKEQDKYHVGSMLWRDQSVEYNRMIQKRDSTNFELRKQLGICKGGL